MIHLKVLAAVLIWGAAFVFTKIALAEISPVTLVTLRCFIASIFLLVIAGKKLKIRSIKPREWLNLAALSIVGICIQQTLQGYALMHTSANHGGWLITSAPIMVAFFLFLSGERIRKMQTAGLILGFAGSMTVLVSRQDYSTIMGMNTGDIVFLMSSFTWAVYVIMASKLLKGWGQLRVIALCMAFSFCIMAVFCLGTGSMHEINNLSSKGILSVCYLGFLSSGLGYLFWNSGVDVLGPSVTASFLYAEPFSAAAAGMLVLGEKLNFTAVAGGIVIMFGLYMVNKSAGKRISVCEPV